MAPLTEQERTKLLAKRLQLETEIVTLRATPHPNCEASRRFRQEDLTALARKIVLIDVKLGRIKL